jgi:hypothetical protein
MPSRSVAAPAADAATPPPATPAADARRQRFAFAFQPLSFLSLDIFADDDDISISHFFELPLT